MDLVLGQVFLFKDVHIQNLISGFVSVFVQTYDLQLKIIGNTFTATDI